MLDDVTKRRINTARDILVGKVPDPKSQVEQITIALIYKFMDDMDATSEEMGGKRTFFTGKFSKYGWRKIFDPKLSGFEMLSLYSEAIQQMNLIPTIPQLFRDIFKNAYLPYRDPETLKAFLKVINEFSYDHSERLGDAFEYLLSVLGSQGDAGQFRTPRHIIDFMVRIADPKKNERILDPACGTAGFLISSYKHILKQNSKDGKPGRGLTTDDRKKLAQQFRGYDISPDMVRLSLVNMYLHGFTQPNIIEYDTLTSEERWNEYYDVVMANPPFMSPKGGIRPHKRFSVQSNRSEVLFVDYLAEHLTPNGRAAVIVPEGIIFQSGTAYKALRKMLVENYLWAVVSLPAGVFQPYSGVKTSILLMDKTLAKRSDSVLFVKLQNDGFDLGAQRRPIDKSDLYFAEEVLKHYQQHLAIDNFDVAAAIKNAEANNKVDHEVNEVPIVKIEPCQYLLVEKNKIVASDDFNLSGDRYKESLHVNDKYELVELGHIIRVLTDFTANGSFASLRENVAYKNEPDYALLVRLTDLRKNLQNEDQVFVSQKSYDFLKKSALFGGEFLIANVGANIGDCYFMPKINRPATLGPNMYLIKFEESYVIKNYVYYLNKAGFLKEKILALGVSAAQPKINKSELRSIKIPLPPLSIQQQIVTEIEGYQKVIDGARQVIENYKPTIRIHPDWEMVELGSLTKLPIRSGASVVKTDFVESGCFRFVNIKDLFYSHEVNVSCLPFVDEKNFKDSILRKGDILFVRVSLKEEGVGYPSIFNSDLNNVVYGDNIFRMSPDQTRITPQFLLYLLRSNEMRRQFISKAMRANVTSINQSILKSIQISLPPIEEQEEIVRQLEMERLLVEGNKQLIARMEQKIKDTIAQVWGEEKDTRVYVENEEVTMAAEV